MCDFLKVQNNEGNKEEEIISKLTMIGYNHSKQLRNYYSNLVTRRRQDNIQKSGMERKRTKPNLKKCSFKLVFLSLNKMSSEQQNGAGKTLPSFTTTRLLLKSCVWDLECKTSQRGIWMPSPSRPITLFSPSSCSGWAQGSAMPGYDPEKTRILVGLGLYLVLRTSCLSL